MGLLALLIYVPLQIVFIPFAVLGIALQTFRQMVLSRRLGVSQTGIEVLGGRWTMHHFGMREDRATIRLARVLPNFSNLGMWTALFPLWVHARIAGRPSFYPRVVSPGSEDMRDLVTARTICFDALIANGCHPSHCSHCRMAVIPMLPGKPWAVVLRSDHDATHC